MRIIFKYYFDVNLFNLIYTALISLFFLNFLYVPIIFSSLGTVLGIFSFQYFYSNEYYFYHNLGFTKKKLNLLVLFLNLFISTLVVVIYQLLK